MCASGRSQISGRTEEHFPFSGISRRTFRTLEHTAQKGIDIIADYQERDFSEKKFFEAVEVEFSLENYSDHDHVPEQTSLIVAWDSRKPNELEKVEGESRYVWALGGANPNVILLKYLPEIKIGLK